MLLVIQEIERFLSNLLRHDKAPVLAEPFVDFSTVFLLSLLGSRQVGLSSCLGCVGVPWPRWCFEAFRQYPQSAAQFASVWIRDLLPGPRAPLTRPVSTSKRLLFSSIFAVAAVDGICLRNMLETACRSSMAVLMSEHPRMSRTAIRTELRFFSPRNTSACLTIEQKV